CIKYKEKGIEFFRSVRALSPYPPLFGARIESEIGRILRSSCCAVVCGKRDIHRLGGINAEKPFKIRKSVCKFLHVMKSRIGDRRAKAFERKIYGIACAMIGAHEHSAGFDTCQACDLERKIIQSRI